MRRVTVLHWVRPYVAAGVTRATICGTDADGTPDCRRSVLRLVDAVAQVRPGLHRSELSTSAASARGRTNLLRDHTGAD
jgi:hypothetical protein